MAREITKDDWPARLDDKDLIARVGGRAFLRATRYVDQGRVSALNVSAGGDILMAQVRGSNGRSYQTVAYARGAGSRPTWLGTCTCPVAKNCKHTAAMLLVARARARRDAVGPDWEAELTRLLRVGPTGHRAMALEIAPDPGAASTDGGPTLLPLVAGRRGWKRQGASWTQVLSGELRGEVADDILDALEEIGAMAASGFYYADERVPLGRTGPRVWGALRRAVAAGLTLTTAQRHGAAVRIAPGLRAGVTMRRNEDNSLVIAPGLDPTGVKELAAPDSGEETASRPGLTPIGDPAHGFHAVAPDGSLLLMPLDPPPGEVLSRLLADSTQPIVVPAAQVDRFESGYLEPLARAVPVLEIDSSLSIPEPTELRAVLRVTIDSSTHEATTSWLMRYVTTPGGVVHEAEVGDLSTDSTDSTDSADRTNSADDVLGAGEPSAARSRPLDLWAQGPGPDAPDEAGQGRAPGEGSVWRDIAQERQLARSIIAALVPMAADHGVLWRRRRFHGMATVHLMVRTLPALELLDSFEVEVVGQVPDYRPTNEAPLITTDVGQEGDAPDWFSLRVRVRVGGDEIPMERLMSAVAAGHREVLLDSGVWVDIDRPEILTLARLMEEGRDLADPCAKDGGALRVTPFQAGYYQQLVALGVVGESTRRWREGVDRLLALTAAAEQTVDEGAPGSGLEGGPAPVGEGSKGSKGGAAEEPDPIDVIDVRPPAGLCATLRPYQLDGYRWLNLLRTTGLGGILADDMGLGKTLQVLAVVQRLVEEQPAADGSSAPVLVVAPTSVVGSWAEQARRFCPGLRVRTVTRTTAKRTTTLADEAARADLLVTSYTIARLDEEEFAAQEWSWTILDEAQFVKNHASATYKAVRRLRAPSTIAITGTPLENSLMDLWSLLSICAPGLLPGPERFTATYRRPIERGSTERLTALRARMRPFLLRRTKEQVAAELPKKTEQVLAVELSAAHRRAYDQRLARERQKVLGLLEEDTAQARFSALKSLTTLRLMALDPALIADDAHPCDNHHPGGVGAGGAARPGGATGRRRRSAKVEVLMGQLRPIIAEGHKALVFSQFTRYLSGVRAELDAAGMRTVYLDGATADRQAVIEAFRNGRADVFLISLKAGGFGLTLTEADYVFLLDPWWNPQAEEQAVDRTHRIGQDRPVMVYRLVSTDTIEEKVMALKEKKAELFARVVEGTRDTAGNGLGGAGNGAGGAGSGAGGATRAGVSRARLSAAEIRELVGG